MPKKKFTSKQPTPQPWTAKVMSAQGRRVAAVSRQLNVLEQTFSSDGDQIKLELR